MISTRFLPATLVLLVVALVPTVTNVYRQPPPPAAGGLAKAVPADLAPFGTGAPGPHDAHFADHYFRTADFFSRAYGSLELFGARTYDAKKLFHNPQVALSAHRELTGIRLAGFESRGREIPVHIVEYRERDRLHLGAYVLIYGDEGVGNPIAFMVRKMPATLVAGRQPMTLLYALGTSTDAVTLERDLIALLKAATDAFAG
ncbi:MAG: hypothetical protein ACYTGN_10015 [Planctomycetota bacterium]